MRLAIFDLDNTLLAGDSDYLWGQFLVEQDMVDREYFAAENQRYYEAYTAGTLDIREFLRFSLKPLHDHDLTLLKERREAFIASKILPIIPAATHELLQAHRQRGDELLIITATNRFVTEPIATALGITHLLATDPEMRDDRYTGELSGIPCFRQGKVQRLALWLAESEVAYSERWFYSDSHNDLPLLEQVDHPIAVDPDAVLEKLARERAWPIVSLRRETGAEVFARATAN